MDNLCKAITNSKTQDAVCYFLSGRAAAAQASFQQYCALITMMYNHLRKIVKIPQPKTGKNID